MSDQRRELDEAAARLSIEMARKDFSPCEKHGRSACGVCWSETLSAWLPDGDRGCFHGVDRSKPTRRDAVDAGYYSDMYDAGTEDAA